MRTIQLSSFRLFALLAACIALNSASALAQSVDVDGDGRADILSYRCSGSTGCTLHFGSSKDGNSYQINLPSKSGAQARTAASTTTGISETVTIDAQSGATITARTLPILAPTSLGVAARVSGAYAGINESDINGYLDYFCANANIPDFDSIFRSLDRLIGQIQGLLNALMELILDPTSIFNGGGNFDNCIPNLGIGISFDIPDFGRCLDQVPDFQNLINSFGNCISDELNVNPPVVTTSNVDPDQLEQCIINQIPGVGLPSLSPTSIVNQLLGLINSILGIFNNLKLSFPDNVQNPLNWLKNYCRYFQTSTTGINGFGSSYSTLGASSKVNFGIVDRGKSGLQVMYSNAQGKTALANCKSAKKGKKTTFKCKPTSP